jgi:cob(I)alamin adenosyltransferase
MPKLTRIYTKTGDDGTTGLVGGQRIKKNDPRIEAYGTVDELSSAIGIVRAALIDTARGRSLDQARAVEVATALDAWLAWTQDILFNLGCELATMPEDRTSSLPQVHAADAQALERGIDRAQNDLKPLDNFIHPGGSQAGAALHLARTICRRAERLLVGMNEQSGVTHESFVFINRLSDALFVWSRWINHAMDRPEHLWNAEAKPPA